MNRNSFAPLRPMIILFILLNAFFIIEKNWLAAKSVDAEVLIAGNLILFVAGLFSFLITRRALGSDNPHAFVRAMYGSFMIKFFVIAIAAFIYIQATKKNVNKPALFACMGFYVVYTAIEVSSLTKLLRKKKNA
ncbi:MAG: hypothetical protein Q8941_10225 [Bacteroidota bacterium]|nr:hypothetical protein [Bacteroidota bacterium]